MKIYSIYRATNLLNGKVYIGFDSNWPRRKRDHLKSNTGSKFHNSIRKHGKDSFIWEVLYQSLDREHCVSIMEPHFIAEHNSVENGYNMTPGGECGNKSPRSKEWKQNHSNLMTGRKFTSEHREKLRNIDRSYMKTQEYRDKVSAAKKGRTIKGRTIITPIGTFNGYKNVALAFNVSDVTVHNWRKINKPGFLFL